MQQRPPHAAEVIESWLSEMTKDLQPSSSEPLTPEAVPASPSPVAKRKVRGKMSRAFSNFFAT